MFDVDLSDILYLLTATTSLANETTKSHEVERRSRLYSSGNDNENTPTANLVVCKYTCKSLDTDETKFNCIKANPRVLVRILVYSPR